MARGMPVLLIIKICLILTQQSGHVIGSTACLNDFPTQLIKYKETKDETLYQKGFLLWCNQMAKIFGEENFFELQPSKIDKFIC